MSTPTTTRPDHGTTDAQRLNVGAGSDFDSGQTRIGAQPRRAAVEHTSPRAKLATAPMFGPPAGTISSDDGQARRVTQSPTAVVGTGRNGSAATSATATSIHRSSLADPFLALAADVLDDTEANRKANENRLRQLTRTATDADGEERGFGMDESVPIVAQLAALVQMMKCDSKAVLDLGRTKPKKERGKPCCFEHAAEKNLTDMLRQHPLGPWIKAQKGVGDKQAARLLAVIGDPYWNDLHDRPRTVSELWAYCGLHVLAGGDPGQGLCDTPKVHAGVAARRQKGQRANWSTVAKTRAWLVIESCMKQLDATCKTDTGIADHIEGCGCSAYRVVIDERRTHTATTHPDWTPKHSQLDGMRVASKELLKDLWREAKRIHEGVTS